MTDSLYQTTGAMKLPALAADIGDAALTLAPLDPARDTLLALLAAAINFELGPAWTKVSDVVTLLIGTRPVQDTWQGPPNSEILLQRKSDFPILFVSRDGDGTYEYHSLARRQLRQAWEIHYVLLPLTVGDNRKLQDALTAVGNIVDGVIERGGHPAYQAGANVLYTAGFSSISVGRTRRGQAKFVTGENAPMYWMFSADVESTEVVVPTPGTAADWKSTGFGFSTGDQSGLIQPFLQADSEQYKPPVAPWQQAPAATGEQLVTGSDNLTSGGDNLFSG